MTHLNGLKCDECGGTTDILAPSDWISVSRFDLNPMGTTSHYCPKHTITIVDAYVGPS